MIGRIENVLRKVRRAVSRSEWMARLLRLPRSKETAAHRGLVIVQIDGLSHTQLVRALDDGEMPFLHHLIDDEAYALSPMYSGVPSTTPSVQGELFYGVRQVVPAFSFVDRTSKRIFKMYEQAHAEDIEQRLASKGGLLTGGSAYSDIFAGGSSESHYCVASMGWQDIKGIAKPLLYPVFALMNFYSLCRTGVLLFFEFFIALGGFVRGFLSGHDFLAELKFVPARVAICILLRELVTIGAKIDVARGLPIIHVNYLGYDEQAHRRGPSSGFAHWTLKGIDDAIGRLTRASRLSALRAYDVWIYSDHGQEETIPYVEKEGRTVQEVVAEVFREHGILSQERLEPYYGIQSQRIRLFGESILQKLMPGVDPGEESAERNALVVSAMGPLGHVYAPRDLKADEREAIAQSLVEKAKIPLVFSRANNGGATARSEAGTFRLPEQAAEVFGSAHLFFEEVSQDVINLCRQPDAGDFIISGWRANGSSETFPQEHGAHGGPGSEETNAFVLLPSDTKVSRVDGATFRPENLRDTALEFLSDERPDRLLTRPESKETSLRIMTYNVHSCIGMDGKLSPERIARVIAQYSPDVVALQELDLGRERTQSIDQAKVIADQLEMLYHFHPSIQVEEEKYGDAMLSRYPMKLIRSEQLAQIAMKPQPEPRGAICVEIEVGGQRFHIVNTHLSLVGRERRMQIEELTGPEWLGRPPNGVHRILCGDFNATPRSPVCRRAAVLLRDCQDGHRDHRPLGTWFSRNPLTRIDHIFVEPELRVLRTEVPRTHLTRIASDHLPLIAEMSVPRKK